MKYKFEDLQLIMHQLEKHSQKGDISVHIDPRTNSIVFEYVSNVQTDTQLTIQPTEINAFVIIQEKRWLTLK